MQHAGFPHEQLGDGVNACDVGQLAIEHAGEGEQGVALVLQRDPHRTDASRVLGLAAPTGRPNRSRRNSTTPRYELRQISVSPTIAWRSQALVTASSNSTSLPGVAGEKASSSTDRALCVCW